MKRLRALFGTWELLLVVLFVLAIVIGGNLSPYFFDGLNLSEMVTSLSERSIMMLAMILIIIVGEIDLSVASILGLASVTLGFAWRAGVPLLVAIALVILIGGLAGALNGFLITRMGLPSLVVTLGTLAFFRGCSYIVLGANDVSDYPTAFTNFGIGTIPGTLIPWPFLLFGILAVVCGFILHFTWLGRQLFAIGNNKEAANYIGINVARIKFWLFVLSGIMAAIAGIVYTARFSDARADNGIGLELDVITIVLLGGVSIFGGKGSFIGVLLSLFIVGIVRNALTLADYPTEVQSIAVGAFLILSVLGPNAIGRLNAVRYRSTNTTKTPQSFSTQRSNS